MPLKYLLVAYNHISHTTHTPVFSLNKKGFFVYCEGKPACALFVWLALTPWNLPLQNRFSQCLFLAQGHFISKIEQAKDQMFAGEETIRLWSCGRKSRCFPHFCRNKVHILSISRALNHTFDCAMLSITSLTSLLFTIVWNSNRSWSRNWRLWDMVENFVKRLKLRLFVKLLFTRSGGNLQCFKLELNY